jgi:hypothetical protein
MNLEWWTPILFQYQGKFGGRRKVHAHHIMNFAESPSKRLQGIAYAHRMVFQTLTNRLNQRTISNRKTCWKDQEAPKGMELKCMLWLCHGDPGLYQVL